jgi:hypothetical protein
MIPVEFHGSAPQTSTVLASPILSSGAGTRGSFAIVRFMAMESPSSHDNRGSPLLNAHSSPFILHSSAVPY